jgi:hypothetical protein
MRPVLPPAAQIVCARVGDPHWRPIPSEKRPCERCKHEVMISVAALARPEMQNPDTIIVCIECAEIEGLRLMPPSAEQDQELKAAGHRGWPLKRFWNRVVPPGTMAPKEKR